MTSLKHFEVHANDKSSTQSAGTVREQTRAAEKTRLFLSSAALIGAANSAKRLYRTLYLAVDTCHIN